MASELRSYGDTSVVRDVQSEIELLSPVENMVLNGSRKSVARNTIHSWQDDTLDTAGSAAATEYKAFTPDTLSVPTLRTNLVQHVYKAASLTEVQTMVTHESGENEWARQVAKKMKSWANAAEYDLVRGSLISGASGTVPRMNGLIQLTSTNSTSQTSGTVFSESILVGLLQLTWEASNGEIPTDLLVGSILKAKISAFTAGITKNIDAGAKMAGKVVQVFESDFGAVNVNLHRYIQVSTDATARILGVNMEKVYVAQLNGEGAKMTEQGVRSTSRDAVINGYLTCEHRNEKTGFFADGYLKAI